LTTCFDLLKAGNDLVSRWGSRRPAGILSFRGEHTMKRFWLLTVIAIPFLVVAAQEAAPTGFEQWTPGSLEGHAKKLHEDAATDPHHFAVEQLADFSNDASCWFTERLTAKSSGTKLRRTSSSCNLVLQHSSSVAPF
jgi:hypothetical protein